MPKIAGFLALLFVLAQWGGVASAQTCEYAGQTFSLGSTVCECPNLRIVRSAISEETEKFFSLAPRSQVLVAVQAICRRFANLSEHCQAMIEGLAASGN